MVRYLAAGRDELDEAAPFDAGRLLGAGLVVAVRQRGAARAARRPDLPELRHPRDDPGLDDRATPWGA